MSPPKNHHFYTESVLRLFTDKRTGKFLIFRVQDKRFKITTPGAICYQPNLNTFDHPDVSSDEIRFGIETLWMKDIEDSAIPIIKKLENGGNLTLQEREPMARFVALQLLRHPEMLKRLLSALEKKDWEKLRDIIFNDDKLRKAQQDLGEKVINSEFVEKARECFTYGRVEVTYKHEKALQEMLKFHPFLVKELLSTQWRICRAPKNSSYITCDDPAIVVSGELPFKVVFMPLSPSILIEMHKIFVKNTDSLILRTVMTRVGIRRRNLMIAANAKLYVISRHEALLKRIVKPYFHNSKV